MRQEPRPCERHPDRLARSAAALYCSLECQREGAVDRAMARRRTPEAPRSGPTIEATPESFFERPLPAASIGGPEPCVYCGLPASSRDHVFPQSMENSCLDAVNGGSFKAHRTVPACNECNCLLGGRVFRTFSERKQCLKDLLRRRYAKYLAAPDWSDRELSQLGYSLKTLVASFQAARDTARARLRW